MPAAPMPATTEPLRPRKGSHPRPRRGHVPQALALKQEAEYAYSARRRSSLAGAPTAPPVVYSFLPSASPGAGWTISPASSASPTTPAPISLFASTAAVSPAVYARRPSAPRVRRVDGDATRPSFDSNRLHFPLPPTSPPRPRMSVSRPSPASTHPLAPAERPTTPHTVGISRASLAQVAQPPLPIRSATLEETQMYDDLKTFVFGAASANHDVDMDDGASDAASAYNPLSPALRPDGAFTRRPSKSAPRRPSRAGLRDGVASGKRRNSRAWIPSDSTVARPEIAVTSVPRDQDCDDDDEDHDELIRMMERAKMRAIDDGARRPSLPINIPDSAARRASRDSISGKPLPDTPQRRPSGALATAGFDLDFILAGPASFPQANPSGQGIVPTAGMAMSLDSYQQQSRRNSAIAPFASAGHEMQPLDVEDTFLSMVRQLDTEYARRRNKWSFRQEPRRAYDYDLDPDEEVWGCEPVGTFWVGKDRELMAPGHEGPTPVIIKPLQPQVSPKSQETPQERRSDIRLCRDEKRPMWRLSLLPAGSQSTVPVKILLATKAMHLKIASVPVRTEGRRRGHTIHSDSLETSLSSSSGELGRIEELQHPKTSHAVAFDTLTDAELDHAGRKHITFSERIRRAFGSESPPPAHSQPSFSPPWLMMAPQSAKEEQIRQIRELHTAFRAVGLLTPPKPGGKDPNQPHAIKPVRMPEEKTSHETPASILEDIPADALCMTVPLWQFRGSATKDEGLGELASVGVPVHEREYLLVYFVPLGAADTPTPTTASRLSKKRSRGNMDRRSSNSVSAAASWAKGRRTAFHVVARVLTASELCATGLRHPSTLPATLSSSRSMSSDRDRKRRAFPSVIAMCNGTGIIEFVPEGLDRLGLCTPSFEWQSESERFPGLTPVGVEVVEMVWAGCVAVLGIGA